MKTGFFGNRRPLSILCLEDNSLDVDLIAFELEKRRISHVITQVWTRDIFESALRDGKVDVVLSDSMLPTFDTSDALAFTRREHPNIPFIFVTGNISPKIRMEALSKGATDYVFKSDLSELARVLEQIGFQKLGQRQDTHLPEVGVPVTVQCTGFRCLGYLDKQGTWRDWDHSKELPDVITWYDT